MKFPLVCLLGAVLASGAWAEVSFSHLNLDQSRLVFAADDGETPVWFQSDLLHATPPVPLTFPPETASYLREPDLLQIRNRFGSWRLSVKTGAVTNVSAQVFGRDPGEGVGLLLPALYSPDGNWVVSWRTTSTVDGTLELRDLTTGQSQTLSGSVGLSYATVPALWSPDSQFLVYEKHGDLYYYSIRQAREDRVPEESLRWLGPGLLSSVAWNAAGDLCYVRGRQVYRILPEEFFTRSLYRAQFQTWGIQGNLPFPFIPARDRFWPSSDGHSILLDLSGRWLVISDLTPAAADVRAPLTPRMYLPLPRNADVRSVTWSDGRITLLTHSLVDGREISQVLRLTSTSAQTVDLGQAPIEDLQLSPDHTRWLVVRRDSLSLCDQGSFQVLKTFPVTGVVDAFWRDKTTLLITGTEMTGLIDADHGTVTPLLWGRFDWVGGDSTGNLLARRGGQWYRGAPPTETSTVVWSATEPPPSPIADSANSDRYRVFVSPLEAGPYQNLIYVRDLQGLTTQTLFQPPSSAYEPIPKTESASDDPTGDGLTAPFRHGSRVRAREVALAIDATDSADGLAEVLRGLARFGFHATFFVNGEFVRRHPEAARELSRSGQEVANQFHLPIDLTMKEFTITADFVRQGLVRQEDDWYRLTGTELALLWHAPHWVLNDAIVEGGQAANYRLIGTDLETARPLSEAFVVPEIIAAYLSQKRPGSILPLTLGWKDSRTGESFFARWDLLLDGLVKAGYRVVTVSQLLDHSRP